jgi:hypothetical protein
MAEIEPRSAKPESLEAKFKLAISLPYDARAKRKHLLVYGFIMDWFHSKYGDALASVRHVADTLKERDPAGVGLSVPHMHGVLYDLVAWGYLHQDKCAGSGPAAMCPIGRCSNASVTPVGNTTDTGFSVTAFSSGIRELGLDGVGSPEAPRSPLTKGHAADACTSQSRSAQTGRTGRLARLVRLRTPS